MSTEQISRSPDLQKLQDEGYEIEVRNGFLLLHSVPYVNTRGEIVMGILATDLTLNNEQTQKPGDHQVWFAGEGPCNRDGSPIRALSQNVEKKVLLDGIEVDFRFSCKPKEGYNDYYEKLTRYVEIISNPARAINPNITACTFKPIEATEAESVFRYTDSASSRVGITQMTRKLAMKKVGIVGLGGTGAYIFDQVAKTHIEEIHLFDGDLFLQHNAFRAPGAVSIEYLEKRQSKVAYYAESYGRMRRGIVPHEGYLDDTSIDQLKGFNFVFICVDRPAVRKLVSDFLIEQKIPFIDVGMGLELIEDDQCLIGTCRVTLCTPEKHDHFGKHVTLERDIDEELYGSNIQVADLNMFNAAMAVMKWKKYCGFYQDCFEEYHSAYAINSHELTRDEGKG